MWVHQEMRCLHSIFYERSPLYFVNNGEAILIVIHTASILKCRNQPDMNSLVYLQFLEAYTQVTHRNCLWVGHQLNRALKGQSLSTEYVLSSLSECFQAKIIIWIPSNLYTKHDDGVVPQGHILLHICRFVLLHQ